MALAMHMISLYILLHDKEDRDVNDLLIHPRAFANLTNQVNQDIEGILYKPPSRLAALSAVLRAIAQPPRRRVRYDV